MHHNSNRRTGELLLFLVIAAIYFYALTHRAFGFFFDSDDIHNLSWGHVFSPFELIRDTLNIATMATIDTYRPVGALLYNLCYYGFGLDFAKFHLVRSGLHLLNASLVFLMIQSLLKDRISAFLGGLFFTFHVAAIAAYWQFSSIFDVLCGSLMFLSFFFYIRASKLFSFYTLASFFFFFLACRAKEMAFVQPVIFLLYEVYKAEENNLKSITIPNVKKLLPFFLLALLLGIPKVYAGFSIEKENPYALEFSSFLDGAKFYANNLFRRDTTSMLGIWLTMLLGALALLLRNRTLQFAFVYVLVSIMPVLLLTNHRHGFYGYIPLFGVSLYVAELFNTIQSFLTRKEFARKKYLYTLLCVFFAFYTLRNINEKKEIEDDYLKSSRTIKNFIWLLQPLHPAPESQFLFDSVPDNFDQVVLTSTVHLLYHEWTITTEIVQDCEKIEDSTNKSEIYCVSQRRQKVYKIPPAGTL